MPRYLFLLIVLYANISISGTIDPNTPDSKYITYADKFVYVGQIVGTKEDDSSYSGSCVAYRKNIVITAAHLFRKSKTSAIIFGTKLLPIKKIVTHKDYNYNKFGKHDIAVCLVSGDINLEWYPDLYSESNESGLICSLAGYGCTGDFKTGVLVDRGSAKRAGSNIVDSSDNYLLYCSPSRNILRTELEYLIAAGDSGGGLFINNSLAGIHSGVIEDKPDKGLSKYGAVSVHTRISVYKEWIEATSLLLLND